MKTANIFYSPTICYEISPSKKGYGIDVYIKGHKHSKNSTLHCLLANFSASKHETEAFARFLCASCALPVHIPELAEEYLCINQIPEY